MENNEQLFSFSLIITYSKSMWYTSERGQ